jgi:nicotinamidase-related amidase
MRLLPATSLVCVIDVQERLLSAMPAAERVVDRVARLADAAALLGVRRVLTEQYPKGLGHTVEELSDGLAGVTPIEKRSFSSLGAPETLDQLEQFGRDQIIVCGIEAHVCVQQSVADILRSGRQAHVALDAIASRTTSSREVGVRRMRAAGMVPSGVELALFEMMVGADHPQFKTISGLVRELPRSFS